jgi:hypothetical protein
MQTRPACVRLVLLLCHALLLAVPVAAAAQAVHPKSHVPDCSTRSGIDKARCERHTHMFAKCGAVQGEAHFDCDREFLLANPLDCGTVGTQDSAACAAETAAMKKCASNAGRAFVRCVRTEINASPMGH